MTSRSKIFLLCALAVFAGAFSFPARVYAEQIIHGDVAPPSVHAEIVGSLLRIEALDGFYPIEAVFINNRRFNFRVDSALMVDISGYIAAGDSIAVYAVDFAGNASTTVLLTPPPPVQPPPPNNITPEGQGYVLDHATDGDGIEFLTINTRTGNVFHLVIDHTRGGNNVYFLNTVTEWDLMNMAAEAELPTPPQFDFTPPTPPVEVEEPPPEPPPAPAEESGGTNVAMIVLMVIAGLGVFAAAYYFKIVAPKQKKAAEAAEAEGEEAENSEDDGDFDDDEEFSDDEDFEIEDENDIDGDDETDSVPENDEEEER